MNEFPRTEIGGLSLSRLVIGTNWFLGYSHASLAKDRFIHSYQSRENVSEILKVFLSHGVDTLLGLPNPMLKEAIDEAQNATGKKIILISAPIFNIRSGGAPESEPEAVFDDCVHLGVDICMPHQGVTDCLLDRLENRIRNIEVYTRMIRDRGMIPGLSTHMPETIIVADKTGIDIETYLQIYNAAGFLMQVEADWIMRTIKNALKPVIVIKPLAAGRLLPVVGLSFVWNTIRDQDLVAVGTTTPDEAREIIDISFDLLDRRIPSYELQRTRSKKTLQ